MKKVISLLVLLSVLSVLIIGCGPAKTEKTNGNEANNQNEKTELRIALDASYRPMEYLENGQISGFDAELGQALAKQMNMDVKLLDVSWDNLFDGLYAKQHDIVISAVTINADRKKTMLFSDPYYTSSQVILTTKDKNIKSAQDLTGKSVAVQEGTTAHEILSSNIPGVTLKTFAAGEEALNAFDSKTTDAVVIDAPVLYDFAKSKNNPDYIAITDDDIFGTEEFGIAANMDNQDLITKINSALATLKSNGEYNTIYTKYFGEQ